MFRIRATARADLLDKHYEGVWLIEAFTFDDNREFSHCTMSASYDDGVSLIFYLDNEFYWGYPACRQKLAAQVGRYIWMSR